MPDAELTPNPAAWDRWIADIVTPMLQNGTLPAEIAERMNALAPGMLWTAEGVQRYARQLAPDTRSQAKRLIDAEALAITADVIDNGQPKDKLMLLRGRGVLDEPASTGVTIIIGGQDVTVNLGIAVVSRDRDTV